VQFAVISDRSGLHIVIAYARWHETTVTFTAKRTKIRILHSWGSFNYKKKSDTHQIRLSIRLQDTLCHILRKDRMRTYLRASSEGSPLYQATADRESSRRS